MSDKRPVCYHEDEDEGYKMNVVENGLTVEYSADQLQKGDLYHCGECGSYTVATLGEPWTPTVSASAERALDVFNTQSALDDFAEE